MAPFMCEADVKTCQRLLGGRTERPGIELVGKGRVLRGRELRPELDLALTGRLPGAGRPAADVVDGRSDAAEQRLVAQLRARGYTVSREAA